MLDKVKGAVQGYGEKIAADMQAKEDHVNKLVEQHIGDSGKIVYGVVQTEKDKNNAAGLATKAILNVALIDFKDYVAAIDSNAKKLILLEISEGAMVKKHIFEKGSYTIKKESKIMDEIFGSIIPFLRRKDRYGRERYIVNGNNNKHRILVGNYLREGSDYPYDNTQLKLELDSLVKALK